MVDMLDFLRSENINESIIKGVEEFRAKHAVHEEDKKRIVEPRYHYFGKEVMEEAISALLCGENLLLVGAKATGKNVLAENLAAVFGRPHWNVSLHINMDASFMLGSDTFTNGNVVFRPGPVYKCATHGGFGILDEINMARNEALAVLHSMLDYRRIIDVPGYDIIKIDEATRFIATMNYGYAGTKELNEALTSRFAVIKMPLVDKDNLTKLLTGEFPTMRPEMVEQFSGIFMDLEKKCEVAEISSKALDLRGLLDAISLMYKGPNPHLALAMGITNKSFDEYEPGLIQDVIALHLPKDLNREQIFTD